MPVAVKSLYLATGLEELKKKSALESKSIKLSKSNESGKLLKAIEKLHAQAKDLLKKEGEEKDEELSYIYLFRAMELWEIVKHKEEFQNDPKFYKLMHGKTIESAINLLEQCTNSLQKRYSERNQATEKISDYNESMSQFKLQTSISFKKRKEAGDVKSASANGLEKKNNSQSSRSSPGDFDLIMNENFSPPSPQDHYGNKKFIECKELKELYFCSPQDVLILDVRPQKDYLQSKIAIAYCINFPETSVTAGMSAGKLAALITDPVEKGYWSRREQYKQVVLMDWASEEKDVIPNSTLDNLLIILLKWDPNIIYKNRPLVLNGGYEAWLDMYPTLSTNPKIDRPQKKANSPFINLADHVIEYPTSELEELTSPKPEPAKPAPRPVTSTPTVDRSTKPDNSKDGLEKPVPKPNIGNTEKMEVDEINMKSKPELEPMEEEKNPTERDQEDIEESPPNLIVVERPKTVNQEQPRTPPLQPTVPSREEKNKYLATSKSKKDVGDNDGGVYLSPLRSDSTPTRSGGLKRSSSSPNINKLLEQEGEGGRRLTSTPLFDRSMKPRQLNSSLYDTFSPRDGNADTVYSASNRDAGRGLVGLKNFGNICYMNSIMQCISNTVALNDALTRFSPKISMSRRQIAIEVSSVVRNLWGGDVRVTSCRNLKNRVGELRQSFQGNEQQDSHEFLTILMDWLHEDLNEPSPITSLEGADEASGERAWGEFKSKNHSVVLDLFYGQLKSTVTCLSCDKQSVSFEPFSNLSVPLPPPREFHQDDRYSIGDCLRLYQTGETISGWVCPSCKAPRDATKKLDITRLPHVLIIHLKRFINEGFCRKRINRVEFPISDFDMKPFTHPNCELRSHVYDLYAVSNHMGSMNQGHYTAYCKNHLLGKWYKFDDVDVTEISPNEVKSSAASAYILFYESRPYEKSQIIH